MQELYHIHPQINPPPPFLQTFQLQIGKHNHVFKLICPLSTAEPTVTSDWGLSEEKYGNCLVNKKYFLYPSDYR